MIKRNIMRLVFYAAVLLVTGGCSSALLSGGSLGISNDAGSVFPQDQVIEVRIQIAEEDYQDMLDNPMAKEYHPADVVYNGIEMTNIAVRTKGNSSLMGVANSDSDRYSLKLSFDEYISGQNLNGIKTINLNNQFSDPSYMREFLSYELLAEMGVPTPQVSYVNVYINDELFGFYLAVEQIQEPYLERHFGNSYGDLYKPDGEGSSLVWQGDDIALYSGLNAKSKGADDRLILTMMQQLSEGSDLEKVINVDGALRYLAVNTALSNMDSYQGNFQHNYYLYEENGVFSILPWDYNMSFGGFGGNRQSLSEMLIDEPTMGAVSNYPLVEKLMQKEEYKEKYYGYLEQIVNGYLQTDIFTARVAELRTLIDTYVEQDPASFYTYEEYERSFNEDVQNVPALLMFTRERTANIIGQLSGELASSADGQGIQGGPGMGGGMPDGGWPGGRGEPGEAGMFGGRDGGIPPEGWQPGQQPEGANGVQMPGVGDNQQMPQGQWGGQGNQRFGEGDQQMPRNFRPGMGVGGQSQQQQGSSSEALLTGILVIALLAAMLLVSQYKKRRL